MLSFTSPDKVSIPAEALLPPLLAMSVVSHVTSKDHPDDQSIKALGFTFPLTLKPIYFGLSQSFLPRGMIATAASRTSIWMLICHP